MGRRPLPPMADVRCLLSWLLRASRHPRFDIVGKDVQELLVRNEPRRLLRRFVVLALRRFALEQEYTTVDRSEMRTLDRRTVETGHFHSITSCEYRREQVSYGRANQDPAGRTREAGLKTRLFPYNTAA